ncbi:MAG: type IV toxin-antitoxin system AbiEi family antitoxin domain-containing protein [Dermatophilaceae bacterium]
MAQTVFDVLLERAVDQHGLVTTDDARELGVDPTQLRLLAARGKLERTGRGVYRVMALPIDDLLPYAEAVAWAHGPAAISHESALAMRDIGDFNPSRVDLTIAPHYFPRRPVPRTLRLWRAPLSAEDVERVDGIPVAKVYTALRQVMASGSDPYHVHRAVSDAYRLGHITANEAGRLRHAIDRAARRG